MGACGQVDRALDILEIRRSGVHFTLLVMFGSVEQTSHSILLLPT